MQDKNDLEKCIELIKKHGGELVNDDNNLRYKIKDYFFDFDRDMIFIRKKEKIKHYFEINYTAFAGYLGYLFCEGLIKNKERK